jgi:hypothetical protein
LRLSKEEKGYWFRRHRKGVLLGLVALITVTAGIGIYTVFKSSNKERFLDFVTANSKTDRATADNFYTSFSPFVDGIADNFYSALPAAELFSKDPAVFSEIYRNIWNNTAIINQTGLISSTSSLFLDLGYYGSVRSLNPDGSGYSDVLLRKETIHAMCNYSDAITELSLPMHSRAALMNAGNMSQRDPIIFNFDPVVVNDAKSGRRVYQSSSIARDVWGIVNLAGERPELASQPKKYEWVNRMIQQLFWDILDSQYGPNQYYRRTYGASDSQVWQVILPFYDYMDALPAKMEKAGIGVVVPFHDSDLLRAHIPDSTNRTMALYYLASIPSHTYDFASGNVVQGIEGMKTFVRQLDSKLQSILSLYPNGQVLTKYMGYKSPRYFFDGWIDDRLTHGLPNTMEEAEAVYRLLREIWKHEDLVEFIRGYGSCTYPAGDWEAYYYTLPLLFKSAGIPFVYCGDFVDQYGGHGDEWGVAGVPQSAINSLKQAYPDVAIGYGNVFGSLLCKSGVASDLSLGPAKGGANSIRAYQQFRGAQLRDPSYRSDVEGKIFL